MTRYTVYTSELVMREWDIEADSREDAEERYREDSVSDEIIQVTDVTVDVITESEELEADTASEPGDDYRTTRRSDDA